MPGPLKVNDAIALAATMCVRNALKALHVALPPGYRPAGHCYALSEATARLLARLDFVGVRVVVGVADAKDWLHERYADADHAWLEGPDGWRFDPKAAAAHALFGKGPTYENYREANAVEAKRLRAGFLNACGIEEGVFDVVVDACEQVTKASQEAA